MHKGHNQIGRAGRNHYWANISANDPDTGSDSKNLILNRDHFWLDDPVKYFCFSGSFERIFLDSQHPIIVYEVSWMNFDNVSLYHVHYVPYYLWRKGRNTGSIFNILWAWTRFKKPTILNQDRNRNIGPLTYIRNRYKYSESLKISS